MPFDSNESQKFALNRELATLNADATNLRKYETASTKTLANMKVLEVER